MESISNSAAISRPEQRFIRTAQIKHAIEVVDDFIDMMLNSDNARLATISGDSRVGKTQISGAILESHPQIKKGDDLVIQVLWISVGAVPTIRSFYDDILEALHVPSRPRDTIGVVKQRARAFLKRLGVRVIILDEFQHLERTRGVDREGVCDTIKTLMNEGFSIIAMGNEKLASVVEVDPQLIGRRIVDIQLYPFCDRSNPRFDLADGASAYQNEFAEYNFILKCFSEWHGCPDTSYLLKVETAKRILEVAFGLYGSTYDLIRHAARRAVKDNRKAILDDDLLHAQRTMSALQKKYQKYGAPPPTQVAKTGKPIIANRDERERFSFVDEKTRKNRGKLNLNLPSAASSESISDESEDDSDA